jgi:MoxR-like ATPase
LAGQYVVELACVMNPDVEQIQKAYARSFEQIRSHVFGQDDAIEAAFVALLAAGHVLLEGVPGVAKTLLVRCVAHAVSCSFGRIQFTPDLMPLDIVGSSVLREERFEFRPGPVFTDLLLADEINRAPAKTQSALLESMQESTVTADGTSHDLPEIFTVFATQNPIDQEGTYPLPESELDRFMMMLKISYPSEAEESQVLAEHHARRTSLAGDHIEPVMTVEQVLAYRAVIRKITVGDEVLDYVNRLVRSTRTHVAIALGASPRAGLNLLRACKSAAGIKGRSFVTPDDVKRWAYPVLRHRLVLRPGAELNGTTPDDVIRTLLGSLKVPT